MDAKLEIPPSPSSTRRRRGQALAEFALTLPILLLLLFGIIEFARIFQAWVTLQNAARTAARYAITGQVEAAELEKIADTYAISVGNTAAAAAADTRNQLCLNGDYRGTHSAFGPYTPAGYQDYESVFANHWDGLDCEPGSEDHQGLINDMGRIGSIRNQARIGAAGLDVRMWDDQAYAIEADPGTGDFVRWANDTVPGWFHVFICSSRPTLREGDDATPRYTANRDNLTCVVQEYRGTPPSGYTDYHDDDQTVNNYQNLQWDAGGPGDAVEIIITFNHPLITPLALPTYVQLQARRVMVNEAFRSSRVVNLPPALARASATPSDTPTASDVPPATDTATPTDTPTATATATQTGTPTATATPDCSMLSIVSTGFSGAYFQVSIRNENIAALNLEGVRLEWPKHALFPNMYADLMQWQGQTHWDGTDTTPPTITGAAPGPGTDATWISSANVRLNGNSTANWQVRFANGPFNMSAYYNRPDFTGSTWYFSNGCVLSYSEATPTPIRGTPTFTPTPVCGTYNLRFEAFWPHGVVQFSITNPGGTPIQITGIDMRWIYYYSGMNLDFISIGGTNAFDPATVIVWNGNDVGTTVGAVTNTATGTLGSEPTWLINATVNVGDTVYMWLDYDGTSESLDTGYGAKDYDFNGTRIAFDNGCIITPPVINTPIPPQCGDSIVQSSLGEQCDDGNTVQNDSCDNNCKFTCGNNVVLAPETCDDGNRVSGDGCNSSCRLEYCGDGATQSALGEQCDDGNTNDTDSCSNTCRYTCGNGVVAGSEQCDDGNRTSGDGCNSSCQKEYCGDGTINKDYTTGVVDQCDDGNKNSGDGCSSTCRIEAPVCGNSRVETGEQCDPPSSANYCSSTCQRIPYCGDGTVNQASEQCEPPNTSTCNATCQRIIAAPVCGNGVVETGEECEPPNTSTCSSTCKISICMDCGS